MTVRSYYLPRSLPEALGLLASRGPELLVLAGGTVAMPLINEGISLPEEVMGLRLAGLDRIDRAGDVLRIGATATLTQLLNQDAVPVLREAAPQHGQLVRPQHGHGGRQPVHASARWRRGGGPSRARCRRGPGRRPGAARSSRLPSSSRGS